MDRVKDIIARNKHSFPEFEYYIGISEKAENNVSKHPDICLETCKALLEGISKSLLERLDPNVTRQIVDNWGFKRLLKSAANLFAADGNVIEDHFVKVCSDLADALGNLRNARGDISHGRAAPKHDQSNERLSKLSLEMSAGLAYYLLDSFFVHAAIPKEEEPSEEYVEYDVNEDFNEFLDNENPIDGLVIYSRALHEQYYEEYLIQLSDYEYEKEVAEEELAKDDDADS